MPQQPSILEIEHGGEIHLATLDARDRILRQPLGMRLSDEDTRGEEGDEFIEIGIPHRRMRRELNRETRSRDCRR